MDLKTLVWFFIFLTLSTSISSNPNVSLSTRSRDSQEQESQCRKSITTHGHVTTKACSTKEQSAHAVEVRILNEYGNRVLPFCSKKGQGRETEGLRHLAGHRAPVSSKKNRASSLYQPCSFMVYVFPCILTFTFFLLSHFESIDLVAILMFVVLIFNHSYGVGNEVYYGSP